MRFKTYREKQAKAQEGFVIAYLFYFDVIARFMRAIHGLHGQAV